MAEITLAGLAVVFHGCAGFVFPRFAFGVAFYFFAAVSFFMVAMALIFLPSGPCVIKNDAGNVRLFRSCPRAGINPNEIIAFDFVVILSGDPIGVSRF